MSDNSLTTDIKENIMNAFNQILSAQCAAEEAAHKAWDKGYITLEEWRAKLGPFI